MKGWLTQLPECGSHTQREGATGGSHWIAFCFAGGFEEERVGRVLV